MTDFVYNLEIQCRASSGVLLACKQAEWIAQVHGQGNYRMKLCRGAPPVL